VVSELAPSSRPPRFREARASDLLAPHQAGGGGARPLRQARHGDLGLADRLFPLAHAHRLARLLPQASLAVIEDDGAFVTEDQPQRVAALIGSFVVSTAPTAVHA